MNITGVFWEAGTSGAPAPADPAPPLPAAAAGGGHRHNARGAEDPDGVVLDVRIYVDGPIVVEDPIERSPGLWL